MSKKDYFADEDRNEITEEELPAVSEGSASDQEKAEERPDDAAEEMPQMQSEDTSVQSDMRVEDETEESDETEEPEESEEDAEKADQPSEEEEEPSAPEEAEKLSDPEEEEEEEEPEESEEEEPKPQERGESKERRADAELNQKRTPAAHGRRRRQKRKAKGSFVPNNRTAMIIAGCVAGGLLVVYLGVAAFFSSHFYMNTVINGKDFSGQTVQAVEDYLIDQVSTYELSVIDQNNEADVIKGSEINLTYKKDTEIEEALEDQNPFLWLSSVFSKSTKEITIDVSYDESALNYRIQMLKPMQCEQTQPVSAVPVFDGNSYVIQGEQYGTAVNLDVLSAKIREHITNFQDQLVMMEEDCYVKPRFFTDAPEVQSACDLMNQYVSASITYPMDTDVVVDKALISSWIWADENMQVQINEEAVRQWMREFASIYDTVGSTRTITSPTGKTVQVSGGTYGWSIDEEMETQNLLNHIKAGEVVTTDPEYAAVAASHSAQDWGSTYVEVDRSAQYMWYIEDGAVAFQANVVTGLPTPDRATPTGVYYILYTQRNATLVGERNPETGQPIYRTPVAYWMPFTYMGHGFHDATWQSRFGGDWYQSHGSHGCVNMSLNEAATLFGMLKTNTPVIVHD